MRLIIEKEWHDDDEVILSTDINLSLTIKERAAKAKIWAIN